MGRERLTVTDAERGLSAAEVASRFAAGQVNDVPVRASRTVGQIVRANLLTRINAILAVLLAIILLTGSVLDAMFGLFIVFNSGVGIVQELRAKRTLDRLAIVSKARPRVRRDGAAMEIDGSAVVLDDAIELGPGEQVIVDGVVLTSAGLELDESLLTGESDPVPKGPGDQVLSGSFVAAGNGVYRASRVGRDAYAARLAEEAGRFTLVHSELAAGVNSIIRFITWLLVPAGALTVWNQLSGHDPLDRALAGMVGALVQMVPEGLVLMVAIAFAVGVIRLGRRQCLVQELPAIEGLARVDVVCADKTGTLTENRMRVIEARAIADGPVADALGALAAADPMPNPSMRALREAYPEVPDWQVEAVAPFSSARKWSGASFTGHGSWVLGAPDVLLADGDAERAEAERIGARGLRVMLLARTPGPLTAPGPLPELKPAALVVLEQQVRPDARETLKFFADEDMSVKVISGDNAVSVGAVAASLDLPGADHAVDARALPADAARFADAVETGTVFGRVTPARKREMVGALRSRGHTVAMTGDGVNDVLALKDADIGVAMGTGSPAARSVAQIVLLDNKFATLPHVVAEGRRVIGNIERVATLFLTKTVYAVLLALIFVIPGLIGLEKLTYPFLPRHITMISWFTIGVPAFVLSLAPNHERARGGFVPRVMRSAVPAGVIVAAATFTAYQLVSDVDKTKSATTALITLITVSLWIVAIVARPYTWWKALLVATMAGLSALMFILPLSKALFVLDPSDTRGTLTGLACAAAGIVLIETARWFDRRLRARAAARPGPDRRRRGRPRHDRPRS
ncbi:HAD-IC family P-type ATPase [Amycolatopsis alkalitolerans]|uniref:HAD-IC family P-type ATPase n=1 Tax=Amycolatopsis alkalitolerans TaxID=2547244 RepID=A0A5C4M345_9PSEU|nr:HAD-IC family P-type ATPase [Amycolatopsis alkalitolerans]TNC24317.1 HAD-IC family P-type ATPase [Amycolatopsis alkalitolerans]